MIHFNLTLCWCKVRVWHNGYKWKLLKKRGVAANFQFPMPSSFIWKLYADNLPNVSTQNPFEKDLTLWRLMRLIPTFLQQKEFEPLKKIFSVLTSIRTAKTLSIKPKSCRFI